MAESTPVDAGIPDRFVNLEVPPDSLPDPETLDWTPLHPRFARRAQVGALIPALVVGAVVGTCQFLFFAGGSFMAQRAPWLPALGWTIVGALLLRSLVWPLVATPRQGYVAREKDLLYKSGVFWRSVQAFPFNRIQHTMIDSAPLDRRFGLANLSVFPAGANAGHKIRGLGEETAERLRAYISERIKNEAATEPAEYGHEPA